MLTSCLMVLELLIRRRHPRDLAGRSPLATRWSLGDVAHWRGLTPWSSRYRSKSFHVPARGDWAWPPSLPSVIPGERVISEARR